jgi:YHS domain-containing protein
MKKIPHLIRTTYIAAVGAFTAAGLAHAAESSEFANYKLGIELIPFAQAASMNPGHAAQARKRAKTAPKLNVDKSGVILKGYDPVAYFKQGKAVKGNPSISSTYHGATYYFVSKDDKADFDKNPAKYEPQYGGFCANAMSQRRLSDSDPNAFLIYKGKLYVCSSGSALKTFSSKPDVNIPKAEANWRLYQLPSSPGFHREFGS